MKATPTAAQKARMAAQATVAIGMVLERLMIAREQGAVNEPICVLRSYYVVSAKRFPHQTQVLEVLKMRYMIKVPPEQEKGLLQLRL